ncbi:histidine phosphatase family protein [Sphingomonas sp. PAMC 26605]|uniref:histidine phosphatase family protein n=1 Tax=Sphingomonas sp. PAMC 26605 TaxID=1112214 RepID=UPI00026CAB92|nr:histidine phosphatase family protein [Sphingomonas sp. PAMC 26605]
MALSVTIVRHGDTFAPGDTPRRIGARTDLPLVASGREQAESLGRVLAGSGQVFDRALTAPLTRSRETLALILAAHSAPPPVETADWLNEIDHGPDEDMPESAVIARIGADAIAAWDRDAHAPDGWSVDADRRLAGWRALWASDAGNIVLVTSNGAARFALLSDPGLRAQAAALPTLKLRTGSFGTIVRADGCLRLRDWNRRA